ncbi:hypothetical protein [Klebsiella pneumoniae]
MSNSPTVAEAIAWLKANTAAQDIGAASVANAIAIFEEAARKLRPPATAPRPAP